MAEWSLLRVCVCVSSEYTLWSDKWWYFGSVVSSHSVPLCFTIGLTTWQTATTEHTLPHLRTLSWNTPGHEFPFLDSSSSAAVCDGRVISGLKLQSARQTSPARVSTFIPNARSALLLLIISFYKQELNTSVLGQSALFMKVLREEKQLGKADARGPLRPSRFLLNNVKSKLVQRNRRANRLFIQLTRA